MSPDQESSLRKQLVCAARALLSMQAGITVGALRVGKLLEELGECYQAQHSVIGEFAQAIPADIPVGTARLYWAPGPLMQRDAVLATIESRYRRELLQECFLIIGLYKSEGALD